MKILFDLGHPAHYHLFKNLIKYLIDGKHLVDIVIRDKDVIKYLLENDNLNYYSLEIYKNSFLGLASEFLKRTIYILNLNRKVKYDLALGTSVSIGFLSLFSKCKSWNFNEDDDDLINQYVYLAYPFASKIINPNCLRFTKFKHKRILYNSYHELAYLHPNNFSTYKLILDKYSLKEKEYVILRLNTLNAHHDIGAKGISNDLYLRIKDLLKDYTIVESKENSKTHQIEPWDMHDVMAHAKMVISDSQTMTMEAAVLGVPSIRVNSHIGKVSVLDGELMNKYKLTLGFLPHQEKEILETISYLLNNVNIDTIMQERKINMLSEKCDFNQWMINYFNEEINK